MNYFLRTNNSNMTSYGGFLWPTEVGGTVEAHDWDPIVECGFGLHGLKDGRGGLHQLAWYNPTAKWVVFSSDSEVVDLDGKWKVRTARLEYVGDVNGAIGFFAEREGLTIREWVCKDPAWAYYYARYVDKEGRDDTRKAVCRDPTWAYRYTLNVEPKGA